MSRYPLDAAHEIVAVVRPILKVRGQLDEFMQEVLRRVELGTAKNEDLDFLKHECRVVREAAEVRARNHLRVIK